MGTRGSVATHGPPFILGMRPDHSGNRLRQALGAAAMTLCLLAMPLPGAPSQGAADDFQRVADQALQAMSKRAEDLRIQGVAVVAYIPEDTPRSWSSKMIVVGKMKNPPAGDNRGANLLAIAYTKAAEMAETLKDSGTTGRPPMTGETGWQGGLIRKVRQGYVLAAFSGGPSEADVKVSRAGLEVLAANW